MKIKILDDKTELTAISFVNGILIGIDENSEDYADIEDESIDSAKTQDSQPKKKLKKNPEDNLGAIVAFIDTDKIERGVDFNVIKKNIDKVLSINNWNMSDFFKNDDIIADFCKHYEYSLPNFVRLMVEHMPDVVNLNFLRTTVRPVVTNLQRMKNEYDSGTEERNEYRKIFAYL